MIAGRLVLADGRLLTVDETAVRRKAEAARDVVDVTDAGCLLRRQSDGSVLPAWFPLEQVRPLHRSA